VEPGVERGARAGDHVRLFLIAQVVFGDMRLAHARVKNQFVFFMLPDGALDIERRLAAHRSPTIAAVIAEEAHMLVAEGEPGQD